MHYKAGPLQEGKRKRHGKFTTQQLMELENAFEGSQYPTLLMRDELVMKTNLTEDQILVSVSVILVQAGGLFMGHTLNLPSRRWSGRHTNCCNRFIYTRDRAGHCMRTYSKHTPTM